LKLSQRRHAGTLLRGHYERRTKYPASPATHCADGWPESRLQAADRKTGRCKRTTTKRRRAWRGCCDQASTAAIKSGCCFSQEYAAGSGSPVGRSFIYSRYRPVTRAIDVISRPLSGIAIFFRYETIAIRQRQRRSAIPDNRIFCEPIRINNNVSLHNQNSNTNAQPSPPTPPAPVAYVLRAAPPPPPPEPRPPAPPAPPAPPVPPPPPPPP